ncbi:sensor histidine kinase [Anaerovorax odorimutans]|uniref:sensor histidine kinase n=1 Tax=Anaerovorax odorimutans TaxID=109327 RepID=UPI000425C8A5|nr:ATP-binding protein [Anaerovorax odorimutans]
MKQCKEVLNNTETSYNQRLKLLSNKSYDDNERDIIKLKEEMNLISYRCVAYEAINDYLWKTSNTKNLYNIVANVEKTINKILEVAICGVFIMQDNTLTRVTQNKKLDSQNYPCLNEDDSIVNEAISTGKIMECYVDKYKNKEDKAVLDNIEAKYMIAFPINKRNETVAVLFIAVKNEGPLNDDEFYFCNIICKYLSDQLLNALKYQKLEKQFNEKYEKNETTLSRDNYFCIVNKEGILKESSSIFAEKLGYNLSCNNCILDYIHPDDKAYTQYLLDNISDIGIIKRFCNRYLCKNGDVVYLEFSAKYCEDSETIISVAKDITDQIKAQSKNLELEKTVAIEKLKSEFFANLSHEFKTPLNIIISSLDVLKLKISKDNKELYNNEYKKMISFAYQNCYKLLRLTTNLLDCTKIENRYLTMHFNNYKLVSLSEEITKSAEVYAQARGISINFHSDVPKETNICCDMDQFDRILLNLISNSIKNTPAGGKIKVNFTETDNEYVISVSDNGVGISDNVLPHVFNKFCASDKGAVGNFDSSGLGLSIVKYLVEMHDGKIGVESQFGKGSRFTFSIAKNLIPEQQTKLPYGINYDFEARQSRVKMELANI